MPGHEERLLVAREVLDGLSVGDAVGEALSYRHYAARESSDFSAFRDGTLPFTDDTEMACAVYETLKAFRSIEEDITASAFARRFQRDPDRGYGKGARKVLQEIAAGGEWRTASANAFHGGSFGNGAAMRVAPLGAYFSGDPATAAETAARSARVTHSHPEGIAGAVAVSVASAAAAETAVLSSDTAVEAVWSAAVKWTPDSRVKQTIIFARDLDCSSATKAAQTLGNGAEVTAQDTVPFCLWNACRNIANYQEAILSTIEAGGDCDTNCAIVGGIVSARTRSAGIPADWLRVREPLHLR